MESKYLEFIEVKDTGKTKVWQIISKTSGFILGHIRWWGAWRQYCFFPSPETLFNIQCMQDIQNFIKQAMQERK